MKWKLNLDVGSRKEFIFDNTPSYGKFRICILDKEHSYSTSRPRVRSFGRNSIPWAASTCPWPRRPKHLYRRIFIRPFRLFLEIVYGDLHIALFISELSRRVIKEMHMYISPGECLCPFNKKI